MQVRLLRRPLTGLILETRCSAGSSTNLPTSTTTTPRRHDSSYRRSRSRLNVPPDASFFPSHNLIQDHVIFNPPSSAPSVLHTPPIFLPKEDPRRKLLEATASRLAPALGKHALPPVLPKTMTEFPRHHLEEKDLREMRRLHEQDPEIWTRRKLANKYGCSTAFVRLVAKGEGAKKERRELHNKKLDVVKAQWGSIRTKARQDRKKRKEMAKSDVYSLDESWVG